MTCLYRAGGGHGPLGTPPGSASAVCLEPSLFNMWGNQTSRSSGYRHRVELFRWSSFYLPPRYFFTGVCQAFCPEGGWSGYSSPGCGMFVGYSPPPPPPPTLWAWDATVYSGKRAIRILLECFLSYLTYFHRTRCLSLIPWINY